MTGTCRAPGANNPGCGYDGESGGCVHARCGYTDGRDTDPSERSFVAPCAAEQGQACHRGEAADSVARLAARAEAGQGARTRTDAGVILDVVARGLRHIETEMRNA